MRLLATRCSSPCARIGSGLERALIQAPDHKLKEYLEVDGPRGGPDVGYVLRALATLIPLRAPTSATTFDSLSPVPLGLAMHYGNATHGVFQCLRALFDRHGPRSLLRTKDAIRVLLQMASDCHRTCD